MAVFYVRPVVDHEEGLGELDPQPFLQRKYCLEHQINVL